MGFYFIAIGFLLSNTLGTPSALIKRVFSKFTESRN